MSGPLRLGVPSKGRLMEKTLAFFAEAGLKITAGGSREYVGRASGVDGIEVALMQAGEMPAALESGAIHLGVTGEDLIRERLRDPDGVTTLVTNMGFGRADLVVAVPKSWIDVETMADLDDAAAAFRRHHGFSMRVATKYLNETRRFFREQGVVDYRIVESAGATEGTVSAGAAEIVVDITSSGETLRANHLKIMGDGLILPSQAQLRASRTAAWGETALAALESLIDRIEARAAARSRVVLSASVDTGAGLADALTAMGATVTAAQDASVTVEVLEADAYAAARILRDHGAAQVESTRPLMLYGAGGDAFATVAATLRGRS